MPPVEPQPTRWTFPRLDRLPPGQELVARGADLAAGTVLAGYRHGVFGMMDGGELYWWSPDPRGVIEPGAVRPSRSLRRSARHFSITIDADFAGVLAGCADPARPHGWITPIYQSCYLQLHGLGWAHSIEVWTPQGELAGGLLFVEVGGLLAGESMFHVPGIGTDASKLAVWSLSELAAWGEGPRLIDVQWCTPHLASLGGVELPRREYLTRLRRVLRTPSLGHLPRAINLISR